MTVPIRRLRVFVVSPYQGLALKRNAKLARSICKAVIDAGHAPFAPHLLYTQWLDDAVPAERGAGIASGQAWLDVADVVLCWEAEGLTEGMEYELAIAHGLGKKVMLVSDLDDVGSALERACCASYGERVRKLAVVEPATLIEAFNKHTNVTPRPDRGDEPQFVCGRGPDCVSGDGNRGEPVWNPGDLCGDCQAFEHACDKDD